MMTVKGVEVDSSLNEKFISKRDVINLCNKLRNTQDKILIYATYCGIAGYKLEDLRNLKYSEFGLLENVIKIKEKEIKIDYFFQELIEEGKKEDVYYVNNGNVANGVKNKFKINSKSEYVLRGKPTSINNNGRDPIGYPSLQSRIKNISDIVGVKITYNKLYRSKIVEEMCLLKQNWRHKEVEEYLKNNELKFKASNILPLINEIIDSGVLDNNDLDLVNINQERVSNFKLTMYQEESIRGLYKVVAGLSMVNEIQKRKIENEHYRANENNKSVEYKLRGLMNSLIELDKVYWEFIINEQFDEQEQEFLIKVYANKEQYEKQNERYYVSYVNGMYSIFANIEYKGPGERNDLQNELYSSRECVDIINKVINDFNEVNKQERELLLQNSAYNEKDKQRFTPPYLNDVGLDMLLALNSIIEFKLAKLVFDTCEKLEQIEGISKATPCIDVSTEGETFIVIIKANGEIVHLKLEEDLNGVKMLLSLGKKGRYIEFKGVHELIMYLTENNKREKLALEISIGISNNIDKLKESINLFNGRIEGVDGKDEFLKIKNKDYLHYYQRNEIEVIFSMYDYDLLVEYNVIEKAYIVKRYIELKGTIEKVFDVFKTRDIEELVKWLAEVKANSYENIDYSMFLVN